MDNTKQALFNALKEERERLAKRGCDTLDHELTMHYLETAEIGTSQNFIDNGMFPILQSAIEDYETLCNDYDIK